MKENTTVNILSRDILKAIHQSRIEDLSNLTDQDTIENKDIDGRTAFLHVVILDNLNLVKKLIALRARLKIRIRKEDGHRQVS